MRTIVNLRATHLRCPIALLEALTFRDVGAALRAMRLLGGVEECAILQTCNRVEIWAALAEGSARPCVEGLLEFWRKCSGLSAERFGEAVEVAYDREAVGHLLRVASGVESMIIGEEQVLGQVRRAREEAEEAGALGPFLRAIFQKATKFGAAARAATGISRGAVSVGSAAVQLVQRELGTLEGRKVLIIGAGETGELVAKALASKGRPAVFVANRTYERGVRLAGLLGGQAVRFEKFGELLAEADAVVVATSAPHPLVTKARVEGALARRAGSRLVIVDLGQPRNVEEAVGSLPNVRVFTIDDLRSVAELNLKARAESVRKVTELAEEELDRFWPRLAALGAEALVAAILRAADRSRRAELEKALRKLGKLDGGQRQVLEDLTRSLVDELLRQPVGAIREAWLAGDEGLLSAAKRLLGVADVPNS